MKINFNSNNVINIYKSNITKQNKDNIKVNKSDSVEISSIGREISKYLDAAKSCDVCNDKIDKIRELIKNNTYEIDSNKIAKAILKEIKESDV